LGLQRRECLGVVVGPAFVAEQPDVLRARQRRVLARAQELAVFLLPHHVDRPGHLSHDVESIEHDPRLAVRQAVAGRPDVRLPHVHRDGLQRRSLVVGQLRAART
jgi:hypothetical protein